MIWCVLWAIFVTDDAASHPFMSEEEKKFIEENHAKAKKDPAKVFLVQICTFQKQMVNREQFAKLSYYF